MQLEPIKPMDSGYDVPCLILYIKYIISYKYLSESRNIVVYVQMLLIYRKCASGTESGGQHVKEEVMKTSHSMKHRSVLYEIDLDSWDDLKKNS